MRMDRELSPPLVGEGYADLAAQRASRSWMRGARRGRAALLRSAPPTLPSPTRGEGFALAGMSALLLASCGQPAAEPDPVQNEVVATPIVETTPSPLPAPSPSPTMPPFAEVEGAHPYPPVPAPIPAMFRGVWAETKAACADRAHPSWLGISGRTLQFPDRVVEETKIDLPAARQFVLTDATATEYHFSIDTAGNRLTDEAAGGAVRVRCL